MRTNSSLVALRLLPFFIFFFVAEIEFVFAQNDSADYYKDDYLRNENFIYAENIKTVVLEKNNYPLSEPVIELNSIDKLVLSFDDLNGNVKNYSYTFIHCNSDWTPSGINISQYLEGYFDDRITDYSFSFNTLQNYTHYKLIFPNENLRPVLSGNYILKVYETENPDKVIITRRWMMFENAVKIEADVNRATVIEDRNSKQEIDFSVITTFLDIQNPFNDIKITLTQNARWDNAIYNLKPLYVKDNVLDYNLSEENVFNGGNEFRNFDTRTIRFPTQFVKKITQDTAGYHAFLRNDNSRSSLVYAIWDDINGKFLNVIYDNRNAETEGEYLHVHFILSFAEPLEKATLYVFGALTDWRLTEEGKLKYDEDAGIYEADLYLKQGYYNYLYAAISDGSGKTDATIIEGNHYETENDYSVYVYYRPGSARYDRLIGWKRINSKSIY